MTHVDLFAGGGGFSRGATMAGLAPTVAVENAPDPAATYRLNFPDVRVIDQPAQHLDWPALARELGDVDLLTAGPPCEPYTPAKAKRRPDPLARLYKDPVGGLVLHTILAIRALRPKAFVIENVVQLMEGPLERELADLIKRAGYRAHFNVLRAEEHGTPSTRARLFLSNLAIEPAREQGATVREAIEDLEELGDHVANHHPMPVPRALREQVPELQVGRSMRRWKGATGKVYGTWTRLDYDAIAPTVKGAGRFVHPVLDRALTPREHARLMGYPDEHVFTGGLGTTYDQVGESVPPPLGAAILGEVRRTLG